MVKNVLIVDDEPEHFANFSEALINLCPDWELSFAQNSAEALALLETTLFDAAVVDIHMSGGTSGAVLLNEISKKNSKTLRLITSSLVNKDVLMKCVLGSFDFLPKPCEPQVLKNAVERALELDRMIGDERMKGLVARIRTFPSIPSLYFEVLKELKSPDASSQRVGEIIAKDLAMSTKVLQALNSAFYALPRQITDPTEAVNILGFEMVKSLILCIQVYTQFDKVKPYYFSIDRLWRHSTAVAQVARKIAYHEGLGIDTADEAYTAGLLHDIGKLVLVSNFGDDYKVAQTMAKTEKMPLWEAEKHVLGADHGEVGAYLIGTWGMPLSLAQTTCYHHCPSQSGNKNANSLTVVHAANVIVSEGQPNDFLPPQMDETYLADLNLQGRSKNWRDLIARSKAEKLADETIIPVRSASRSRETRPLRAPSAPTPPTNWGLPAWFFYAFASGCLVVVGIVLWRYFFLR